MTPLVAELHNAHKERLARFARAAANNNRKPAPVIVAASIPETRPQEKHWFKIEDFEELSSRRYAIEDIQKAVCAHYGLTKNDLICARRTKELIIPRHVAMYLCRQLTPRSYPWIGRFFGSRDHTVPIYAYDKIKKLIVTDAEVAADVATICSALAEREGK